MSGYQVALFIGVFASIGLALAVWLFRRRGLGLVGTLVLATVCALLAVAGYWLGVGFAFMYLDVAQGVAPPVWAQWAVGVFFGIGLASAAFGGATLVLGIRAAVLARHTRQRVRVDSAA
jgi:hypothetical protein